MLAAGRQLQHAPVNDTMSRYSVTEMGFPWCAQEVPQPNDTAAAFRQLHLDQGFSLDMSSSSSSSSDDDDAVHSRRRPPVVSPLPPLRRAHQFASPHTSGPPMLSWRCSPLTQVWFYLTGHSPSATCLHWSCPFPHSDSLDQKRLASCILAISHSLLPVAS